MAVFGKGRTSPLSAFVKADDTQFRGIMKRAFVMKCAGAGGAALILYGYYLLQVSPDADLQEVIMRTRTGILVTLIGSLMAIYYLFMK